MLDRVMRTPSEFAGRSITVRQRERFTPNQIRERLNRGEPVAWFGLVNNNGDLASVGTESMFEGGVRPASDTYLDFTIIDFGDNRPDMTVNVWDREGRRFVARPIPVVADRVADIRERLEVDADWSAAIGRLSAARRDTIYNGLERTLDQILGEKRYRNPDEDVELKCQSRSLP